MKNITLIAILSLGSFIAGCSPDEDVKPEEVATEVQTMSVIVNHKMGDADLTLGSEYTLPSMEQVSFSRLSYILSDFYLVKSDDTKVLIEDSYVLINALNDEKFTLDNVTMGDYKSIGFSIGLDSSVNHGNPNQYATDHPLSPINNSLHWSWEGGYIFTALEGKTKADDESFVFHLAGYRNKTNFELPATFTKGSNAKGVSLNYDVTEVFQNPKVYNISMDGASSHSSSDPVTTKLIANMADVFSVQSISEIIE